jgi:hypothetical protein
MAGRAKGAGRGGPARGYTRPPAESGNGLALVHGAASRRVVDPVAAQLVSEVLADDGTAYLTEPKYAPALRSWSRCEARVLLLAAALDRRGLEDDDGNPSPWLHALERAEGAAARARSELGLSPASYARLGRDLAAAKLDLARLWAEDEGGETA